ncbi:hypothetical protein [Nostoc sp. NMS4]|uniref:hypothetical protein n=1 Tax=Nostoc sp. NMS4 TaxID=2815390 RepID=UPI0025EC8335|nr:hypothetical protein [Nostoc sp. NMS4]MBN3924043.1 hypothetical protein [Nostoc sp. NMS4]
MAHLPPIEQTYQGQDPQTPASPKLKRTKRFVILLGWLMVSLTGTHTWGSGRFGLTLEVAVGLWCAIGWWRCRANHVSAAFINLNISSN